MKPTTKQTLLKLLHRRKEQLLQGPLRHVQEEVRELQDLQDALQDLMKTTYPPKGKP